MPARPAKPGAQSGVRSTELAYIGAATKLFADKGYHGTSINELARQLGLTSASLYYHVQGKQELLLKVLEGSLNQFLPDLEDAYSSPRSPSERLRLAVEHHLDVVLEHPEAVAVFLRERRFLESPYLEEYQDQVERYDRLLSSLIAEYVAAEDQRSLDPDLARMAILGMINWMAEWFRPEGRLTREEVKSQIVELIFERVLRSS